MARHFLLLSSDVNDPRYRVSWDQRQRLADQTEIHIEAERVERTYRGGAGLHRRRFLGGGEAGRARHCESLGRLRPKERAVDVNLDEEAHGLVLRGDLSVDRAATDRRRHELRAARTHLTVAESDRDLYRAGRLSRRRICPLNPADALVLRVDDGDMVEILGTRGAPLRAWVELDRDLAAGTVPLDPLACAAIGATPGAAVHLRRLRKADVV